MLHLQKIKTADDIAVQQMALEKIYACFWRLWSFLKIDFRVNSNLGHEANYHDAKYSIINNISHITYLLFESGSMKSISFNFLVRKSVMIFRKHSSSDFSVAPY